jgi:hypothetical protein
MPNKKSLARTHRCSRPGLYSCWAVLLVVPFFVRLASAGTPAADGLLKLDAAEKLWAAANINSYSYSIYEGGVFGGSTYRLTVIDGRCKARFIKSIGMREKFGCTGHTMPDLFGTLRAALNRAPDTAELSFDERLGYITRFYLWQDEKKMDDSGWGVTISDFKAQQGAQRKGTGRED